MTKIIVSFDMREKDRMEEVLREVADEFMGEVAKEILTEAKYNMLEEGSIVTGKLEASGYVKKIEQGDWEVGFSAPYAGFVEYGCYDEETEILTNRGWLKWYDVTEDDYVLEFVPETKELKWTKIQKVIVKDYEGDMIHIKGRSIDLLVTPEHRMVYYTRNSGGEWKVIHKRAANEMTHYAIRIPRAGIFKGVGNISNEEFPIYVNAHKVRNIVKPRIEDLVAFVGLWVAEGWRTKNGEYLIELKQKDGEKSRKIEELLDRLGFNWSKYTERYSHNGHETAINKYRITSKALWEWLGQFGDGADNKEIPRWFKDLNSDLLRIFIEWYMLGDGWNGRAMATKSDKLADDLQEIAIKCGYGASKRKYSNGIWTILIEKDFSELYPKERANIRICQYKGKIWDVYIGGGYLVVRRNGNACISGNTAPRQKLPPVNKLAEWAKIKFGLAYTDAKKVAWAVAHWIKEHGTKPHPFFRPAIYKVVDKYKNLRLEEKEVK